MCQAEQSRLFDFAVQGQQMLIQVVWEKMNWMRWLRVRTARLHYLHVDAAAEEAVEGHNTVVVVEVSHSVVTAAVAVGIGDNIVVVVVVGGVVVGGVVGVVVVGGGGEHAGKGAESTAAGPASASAGPQPSLDGASDGAADEGTSDDPGAGDDGDDDDDCDADHDDDCGGDYAVGVVAEGEKMQVLTLLTSNRTAYSHC